MIRKILTLALVAGVSLGASVPAYAHESEPNDDRKGVLKEVDKTVKQTTDTSGQTVEKITGEAEKVVSEKVLSQREKIDAKKAELEAEVRQRQAEKKVRLEGRRLAVCQNREANINELLDKSASNGQERLAKIRRFEEGVKQFYQKKELSSAEYDAAVTAVDNAEAAALAALQVIDAQQFNCDALDADTPSSEIKDARESKRLALAAYRDEVIKLLHIVKATFAEKMNTTQTETN